MTEIDINPYNNQNLALSDIGSPIFCFTKSENRLNNNEIWLEGALVKIDSYPILFKEYEYDYTPEDIEDVSEGYFYLPDFRDKTLWGSFDNTFGYLDPTLPNITGSMMDNYGGSRVAFDGVFKTSTKYTNWKTGGSGSNSNGGLVFNAHNSDPTYQDGATVRPPSIKCRVKTRYK